MTGIFRPGTLLANSDGVLAGAVRPAGLPLDIAPGAAGAWSLRKLSSSYAGPAVNVRRSSDSTTQNIGFVGNDFDLASFNAFVGGGSGFVATWYDQSGNANNAVQATAANQPQLITGIAALNARMAIDFGAGDASFNLPVPASASLDGLFANGGWAGLVIQTTGSTVHVDYYLAKIWLLTQAGAPTAQLIQAATANGTFNISLPVGAHQWDVAYSSASLTNVATFFVDGGPGINPGPTQPTGTITSDAGQPLTIGNSGGSNIRGLPGRIAEVLLYKSSLPFAAAPGLRANQAAYWTLPVMPLDMAPGAAAAWSLRRLSASYAGMAVNVRRSSDNAVQDIGFVGNDFDLASFNTFVGGGTGFVVTWYDQSGHGLNLTQATAANQPAIATAVGPLNGRPALNFMTAANNVLNNLAGIPGIYTGASPGLISTVCNVNNISASVDVGLARPVGAANPNVIGLTLPHGTGVFLQLTSGFTPILIARWQTSSDAGLGAHVIEASYQWTATATPIFTVDGSTNPAIVITPPAGTPGTDTGTAYNLGAVNNAGANPFTGHIAEQIAWSAVPVNMSAVRNGQKAYWGTP